MANLLADEISSATRSVVRRLEDLLPQIEAGLSRGYSHAGMHAALSALGINISLAYYHRVLRLLRKERRDGKLRTVAPLPVPALPPAVAPPSMPDELLRTPDLPCALALKEINQTGNISAEKAPIQPFRWKGQEFLNKDWSNF
jgi:hypothetical protein